MFSLPLFQKRKVPLNLLFLGAHSDDIEIGCGGTILRLLENDPHVNICWVVFSAKGERYAEAEKSAQTLLGNASGKEIIIKDFMESFFPYSGPDIKNFFEILKKQVKPDVVFTHYRDDLHQDHRLISDLTWNTFRDHFILEYEIVKYDGDLGKPNSFVHLSEGVCRQKIAHIAEHFKSQQSRHWFTDETFRAILRLRGVESNAPEKYAEAFYSRKTVLG